MFIIHLLSLTIFCSAICLGFYTATKFEGSNVFDDLDDWARDSFTKPTDRMILWWVRWYGGRYLNPNITKPLYRCLPCMSSLHSIVPTWLYFNYMDLTGWWLFWPFIALATCGVNTFIVKNYNTP